jgi:hypothetical protein
VAIVTLIHVQSLHVSNAGIVSTTFLMVVLTVTKREGATASQVPSEMVTARDSHA